MIINQSVLPVGAPPTVQSKTSYSDESGSLATSAPTPYVTVTVDDQYAKTAATAEVKTDNTASHSLPAVQDAYQDIDTESPEVSVTFGRNL